MAAFPGNTRKSQKKSLLQRLKGFVVSASRLLQAAPNAPAPTRTTKMWRPPSPYPTAMDLERSDRAVEGDCESEPPTSFPRDTPLPAGPSNHSVLGMALAQQRDADLMSWGMKRRQARRLRDDPVGPEKPGLPTMEERERRRARVFANIDVFQGVKFRGTLWRCCNCAQYVTNSQYDTRCEYCKIHVGCANCEIVVEGGRWPLNSFDRFTH
jgi:hypothetical protein